MPLTAHRCRPASAPHLPTRQALRSCAPVLAAVRGQTSTPARARRHRERVGVARWASVHCAMRQTPAVQPCKPALLYQIKASGARRAGLGSM